MSTGYLIVYAILSLTMISYSVYASRPKLSQTDKLFKSLNKAIRKGKASFECDVSLLLQKDMKEVQAVLDHNGIKHSFYKKNGVSPTMITLFSKDQGALMLNAYSRPLAHPAKPRALKLLKAMGTDSNVIPVDFKSKRRS